MSKSRLEWKVGLFVLISSALLAGLLLQFSKGTSLFKPTYNILLRASNVGGLKPKASVLMAGVQIGTVADIKLGPQGTNVTITLRIYEQYQIHKDARFIIEQSGFLGDQYVSIIPTKNEGDVYHNNEVALADAPFNLQEVARYAGGFLQRVDETATRLNEIITNVSRVLVNGQNLTNLSVAVSNLRTVSEHALISVDELNALLATNGPALSQSGSNLLAFSEQLKSVAGGLNDVVATNSTDIHAAVKNIESSTEVLKTLMEDVRAGKGLAGNLVSNEELAAKVTQTVDNLSITTSNLNRLGLWGIMWKKKVPPPAPSPSPSRPLASPKAESP